MTVSQKNSRSKKASKASQSKKAKSANNSSAFESSQGLKFQDSLPVPPYWQNESTFAIMDLQAYFLLAADLLNKVEVDHNEDETPYQITERLWSEWIECFPVDDIPPNSGHALIIRLKLIYALKYLHKIKSFISDESPVSRKNVANNAKELIDLLSKNFADGKFMNSSTCIKIMVDLMSMFVFYELASGVQEGDSFRAYRKGEGKAFIESVFQMDTLSTIPLPLESKVSSILSDRLNAIKSSLETDTLVLDENEFPNLETNLRLFLVRIFQDVNTYSLPELHPEYEDKSSMSGFPEFDFNCNRLDDDQVAHILSAMNQVQKPSGSIDLGDLDDFLSGESWPHSNKKLRSPSFHKSATSASRKGRTGGAWTQEETNALEKGMQMFKNDWKAIKHHFSETLHRRTNVNLKDRARNVKRKLIKEKLPLGIWHLACG